MSKHQPMLVLLMLVILPVMMLVSMTRPAQGAIALTPTLTLNSDHPYKIAYQATDGDLSHIYLANYDGSDARVVSGYAVNAYAPVWSPDGKKIAFFAGNGVYLSRLYVMNADGTVRHSVKYYPYGLGGVSWSLDGTRLVIASLDIDIIDLQGNILFHLPGPRNLVVFGRPIWSPDGKSIAYRQDLPTEKRSSLFLMNADGTHQRRLSTVDGATENTVAWSPDSQQIAFVGGSQPGERTLIYLINADGSNEHLLVQNSIEDDFPAWSPDGKQIAYLGCTSVTVADPTCYRVHDLHVINTDGTNNRLVEAINENDLGDMVAWSPDGQYLAYESSSSDMNIHLGRIAHVVKLDGTDDHTLLNNGTAVSSSGATWQP